VHDYDLAGTPTLAYSADTGTTRRVRDNLGGVRSQNLMQGGRCWRQTAGFRRRLGGEPCRSTLF